MTNNQEPSIYQSFYIKPITTMNSQETIQPKGFLIKKSDLAKWKATFDYPEDRLCTELKYLKKVFYSNPTNDPEHLLFRPRPNINLPKIFNDFSIKYTTIE